MSMLTAQANHLREMAYTVERVKNDAVGKLSLSGSITLAMAAMDMRDAADTIAQLRNTCYDLQRENEKLKDENAKLMELATYALRHIIEAECEKLDRKTFRGKPCEYCVNNGSSDCPKCMPRMFDVSGIEVDE